MIFRARNLVFLILVAAIVFAEEPSKPVETEAKSEKKALSGPQPIPTNSAPSNSSTTTVIPPVTTTTPAPTTPAPTTPAPTTPTPTTTTTTSTSTTTTTTTTTAKPTPPPTPSTTPQPAPTTHKPPQDSWIVTAPNGTVCITANMVIKISVPYKSIENKTVESAFMVEHVENATASGTCTGVNNSESLELTWGSVNATFTFTLNASDHTYALSTVNVAIPVNNVTFPNNTMTNVTEVRLLYAGKLFSVPQNNSYTCTTVPPLSLTGATFPMTNTTVSGKLTVAHVHVQAYGKEKNSKYRTSMDCASTETPDIVPIAVGLVLAGLVVVVLVAYLVGRRRAQARGYLSM